MKLVEYTGKDALMVALATVLETALSRALDEKETVTFAVPGGTTPGPLFDALSAAPLAWERVHVILTDERWVPQIDPQSNAALIKQRLLTCAAAAAQFTPYYSATSQIAEAAAGLSTELQALLPIDVLLLGMGADMHMASLFPDAAGLDAALSQDAPMFLPVSVPGHTVQRFHSRHPP
jgi:6-phosphogluconolactonase